jgi:hypothetical protein
MFRMPLCSRCEVTLLSVDAQESGSCKDDSKILYLPAQPFVIVYACNS